MVARFVRDEEAVGSNPATPTKSPEPQVLEVPGFSVLSGARSPAFPGPKALGLPDRARAPDQPSLPGQARPPTTTRES